MEKIKVLLLTLYFMVLDKEASSLTMKTEDVVINLQEDNRITLNCTYNKDNNEVIANRYIKWKKLIDGAFKDVAIFSPPGGPTPFIKKEMENLYKNRTELIGPNISFSAVMIIKDLLCTDEGTYKCWIEYYVGNSNIQEEDSSVVKFNTRATKPQEFLVFPNELEENQSISIHCIADVGSPQGYIQIWKKSKKSITEEVIYKSTTSNGKTENCTELINVTTTYILTREDNGAFFRCSSKNNLTKDPVPSSDPSRISVTYGPDKPAITLTPNKPVYAVEDQLTIQCISDSNPPPVFTWSFKPHNKSRDTRIKHSNDSSKLVFSSLKIEDSGIYICTVSNSARPHFLNTSANFSVLPKILERENSGCNQCGYIETCQQDDEKTVCIVNIWLPIAVVFILLSAAFAVSSVVMIRQRNRAQENTATNNILTENRSPPSVATPEKVELHGGYISPEDLEFGCPTTAGKQKGNGAAYSRL